jgi:hypothetical protein
MRPDGGHPATSPHGNEDPQARITAPKQPDTRSHDNPGSDLLPPPNTCLMIKMPTAYQCHVTFLPICLGDRAFHHGPVPLDVSYQGTLKVLNTAGSHGHGVHDIPWLRQPARGVIISRTSNQDSWAKKRRPGEISLHNQYKMDHEARLISLTGFFIILSQIPASCNMKISDGVWISVF